MTDREDRMDGEVPQVEADGPGDSVEAVAETSSETVPSVRPRRSWQWWLGRIGLTLAVAAVLILVGGLLVYNYGTMMPPSAEVQADYDTLVSQGKAPPEASAPGLRIPVPGCVCHAADSDIASKDPGHVPDPILVITHRYRTLSECFTCHSQRNEAQEGPVPGEPGNQPVMPAQ